MSKRYTTTKEVLALTKNVSILNFIKQFRNTYYHFQTNLDLADFNININGVRDYKPTDSKFKELPINDHFIPQFSIDSIAESVKKAEFVIPKNRDLSLILPNKVNLNMVTPNELEIIANTLEQKQAQLAQIEIRNNNLNQELTNQEQALDAREKKCEELQVKLVNELQAVKQTKDSFTEYNQELESKLTEANLNLSNLDTEKNLFNLC